MSVPKSKRKLSTYGMVDLAIEINYKIEKLYWKVYNYSNDAANVVLGKPVRLSHEILDYTVRAQERQVRGYADAYESVLYLQKALDALNSLDVFLTDSMTNMNHLRYYINGREKGVTFYELYDISTDTDALTDWISDKMEENADYLRR